jgi:hypothetical protein
MMRPFRATKLWAAATRSAVTMKLFVSHRVARSWAVTKEQCKQLISYLQELSSDMPSLSEEQRQGIEKQLKRP